MNTCSFIYRNRNNVFIGVTIQENKFDLFCYIISLSTSLHLSVVAIEKGAFWSPSTTAYLINQA